MLRKAILVATIFNFSVHGRLKNVKECPEPEEIEPAIEEFNFTEFSHGTWYELYAYDHPLNLDSRCVRTTFAPHEEEREETAEVHLITNLINPKNFLTRLLGSAVVDEEAKGFDVLYYAIPHHKAVYTVLDVIYSEYALLYACMEEKYMVGIWSRQKYLKPQTVNRALKVLHDNSLSIFALNVINQNCNFANYV